MAAAILLIAYSRNNGCTDAQQSCSEGSSRLNLAANFYSRREEIDNRNVIGRNCYRRQRQIKSRLEITFVKVRILITEKQTCLHNLLPRVPWRLNPAIVAEDELIN